jgi:hypothetical protein
VEVRSLSLLPDGGLLVGGNGLTAYFGYVNTGPSIYIDTDDNETYVVRILPDGSLDTTFNPVFNNSVAAVFARSNGEFYIGGSFTADLDNNAVGVVRFSPTPNLDLGVVTLSVAGPIAPGTSKTLTATASSLQGQIASVELQVSPDNVNFTTLGPGSALGGNVWAAQWTPNIAGTYYLRILATDTASNVGASVAIAVVVGAPTQPAPVGLPAAEGSYEGLVDGNEAGDAFGGYATFTLTKTGRLTGKVLYNGVAIPVNGVIDANGNFTGQPPGLGLYLAAGAGGETDAPGYSIFGAVSGQGGSASFQIGRAAYSAGEAVPEAGKYTVLLSASSSAASIPQGTGYAFVSVAKTGGGVVMSGKLADGTPFSAAGFLVQGANGDQVLVSDPLLYSKKGLLAGFVTFEKFVTSDFDGVFEWVRPPETESSLYAAGFATDLGVIGSIYVKPAKNVVLPSLSAGTLTLTGGGLSSAISQSLSVSSKGALVVIQPAPYKLKIVANTATGAISGSFVAPFSKLPVSFSGALYQNANLPEA